ncbi:MAG: RNA methyltransferase, partial [Gemmatimonadota bacterium]|nr:RNA methyltransferase [Gemmatimonadota bacterium]
FLAYVPSLEDTARGATLLRAAEARGVSLRPLTQEVLEEFADTENPQGVLAVAETPTWRLDHLRPSGADGVILILDAVQDPGNFGALARTAEALGALGIIALPGTVDAWNPKAVRAAMGSTFRLPTIGAGWEAAAPWLAAEGFAILAATAAGEPLRDPPRRAALVVGNEGAGISPESLHHAALQVGIPLRGRAESLGVTAAAAILLHALLQSR